MLRTVIAAAACWSLSFSVSTACTGQTGNIIFEDTFSDDSGGWEFSANQSAGVKGRVMEIHPNLGGTAFISKTILNLTFSANDGDYCMDFVLPKQVAPDNHVQVGLIFHRAAPGTFLMLSASTNKKVDLFRWSSPNWNTLYINEAPNPPINLEPNAVNSLRVIAKDGKISSYLNEQLLKVVRTQTPAGDLRFGIYAQVDKASDQNPVIYVKSFKVTTGQ